MLQQKGIPSHQAIGWNRTTSVCRSLAATYYWTYHPGTRDLGHSTPFIVSAGRCIPALCGFGEGITQTGLAYGD